MFKRLYNYGGIAFVIGGIAVLAMIPAPTLFAIGAFGAHIPEKLLMYSGIAFLVGGMICSVIFNGNNMQIVAQNRTTEALQRISEQLEEHAVQQSKTRRRHSHRHAHQ